MSGLPAMTELVIPTDTEVLRPTQQLKLGEEDMWTLFDDGATIRIIDGKLAEDIGLQKVSNEPRAVEALNGEGPAKGTYKITLGPDKFTGEYHQLHVVMVENFTIHNQQRDLIDLIWKLDNESHPFDPNNLQSHLGSGPVWLLLGSERLGIHPRHLETLDSGPSGVALNFPGPGGEGTCPHRRCSCAPQQ